MPLTVISLFYYEILQLFGTDSYCILLKAELTMVTCHM